MSATTFWKCSLGALLAIQPLVGRCLEPTPSAPSSALPSEPNQEGILPNIEETIPEESSTDIADIAEASPKSVSQDKPLPTNIHPTTAASEIIKLANSGLDQSVMLAFVTNSTATFNLGAEEIIYLNDIGVPSSVVTAMIQRDQALKSLSANLVQPLGAGAQPSNPSPLPMPTPPGMPTAEQVAPQPLEASSSYPEEPAPPSEVPTDASFYDSLSPYGTWVNLDGYGWCWQPTTVVVNPSWQPYFDCGHWLYSDCGWYWCSDYSWGWAPFHYGRWFNHHHLGWCWAPGTVWAPSWVCWRHSDRFCGWAPLPPGTHFTAGVGLTFHGHSVKQHDDLGLHESNFHFVAWNHFREHQLGAFRLPRKEAAMAYSQSTVTTRFSSDGHTIMNNGVPPTHVVAVTHTPIHTVALKESGSATRTGRAERFDPSRQSLEIYRPRITQPATGGTSGSGNRHSINSAIPWGGAGRTTLVPSSAEERIETARLSTTTGTAIGKPNNESRGNQPPLILRGSQPAAPTEAVPRNSLIIIGRKDASGNHAMAMTAPPRTPPSRYGPSIDASAENARSASVQAENRNPAWLTPNAQSATHFNQPSVAYRPEVPRYQAPARTVTPDVPRFWSGPANVPQHTFVPPAMPTARPSPPPQTQGAPPAPSAPAAATHAQSNGGRNSR